MQILITIAFLLLVCTGDEPIKSRRKFVLINNLGNMDHKKVDIPNVGKEKNDIISRRKRRPPSYCTEKRCKSCLAILKFEDNSKMHLYCKLLLRLRKCCPVVKAWLF